MVHSGHKVEVVEIGERKPISNSDFLSQIEIDGYSLVINTEEWKDRKVAAYIPPDNYVDTTLSDFAWLSKDANSLGLYRVRAKKIRGTKSFGLLVPIDETLYKVGEDVTDILKVKHYLPSPKSNVHKTGLVSSENTSGPNLVVPKYDLENFRKYHKYLYKEGDKVIITEKLEGQNCRYVYHNGKMYCGSRNNWKAEFPSYKHITLESLVENTQDEAKAKEIYDRLQTKQSKKNCWWRLLEENPAIEAFCKRNPDHILFGEMYGYVKGFPYDCKPGQIKFAAFDVMFGGEYLDWPSALFMLEFDGVPIVPHYNELVPSYTGITEKIKPIPFDFESICEMAEGTSKLNSSHIKEGVVIRKLYEFKSEKNDIRGVLKCVGCDYLSKKKGDVMEESEDGA